MAQIPYEFLVRWNHTTGALQGAYVKTFDNVANKEGDAQPVAVAGQAGFPLTDVMTALQSGTIISMDAANVALATEQAAHAATSALLAVAQAKLTKAGIA